MGCKGCWHYHPDEDIARSSWTGEWGLFPSGGSYCHWKKGEEPAPCECTRALVKRFVVCHGAGMSETDDYTEAQIIARCIGGGRSWVFDTPIEPSITDNDMDAIWHKGHWN